MNPDSCNIFPKPTTDADRDLMIAGVLDSQVHHYSATIVELVNLHADDDLVRDMIIAAAQLEQTRRQLVLRASS